jgi:hypothetical protein
VNSLTDSFAWPLQDPGWPGKILVQGLIAIIPIVGWIALAGWMVITIDNFRAGRKELAPAGFHLERGLAIFLVYVIYSIVFAIPGGILSGSGAAADNNGLTGLGNLVGFVLHLLLYFLTPAIILFTYREGFNGGFNINGIWQMAMSNTSNSVLAALMMFVASLVGGVGVILCCVGLIFTVPYGIAVNAGVVTWYEKVMGSPSPAAPPPAAA